jgi:hypothetical protein
LSDLKGFMPEKWDGAADDAVGWLLRRRSIIVCFSLLLIVGADDKLNLSVRLRVRVNL